MTCDCFNGYNQKQVKSNSCLTVYETQRSPLHIGSIHICQYLCHYLAYLLKIIEISFCYKPDYPPTLNDCYCHKLFSFHIILIMPITLNSILLLVNSKRIIISWNHLTFLEIDRLYCSRKVLVTKNNVSYISGCPTHFQRL